MLKLSIRLFVITSLLLVGCTIPPIEASGDEWEVLYQRDELIIEYIGEEAPPDEISFIIKHGSRTTDGNDHPISSGRLKLTYPREDLVNDDITIKLDWNNNSDTIVIDKENFYEN